MPSPGGYWLTPSAIAFSAALSIAGGPSSSGNPCPRLTAPMRAANADISAKIVNAYGCSRDTVMVVEPRPTTMRRGTRWEESAKSWPADDDAPRYEVGSYRQVKVARHYTRWGMNRRTRALTAGMTFTLDESAALLKPVTVGDTTAANRIFMAPLT